MSRRQEDVEDVADEAWAAEVVARHRTAVEAHPEIVTALAAAAIPDYHARSARREEVIALAEPVVASLVILTAARVAGVPLGMPDLAPPVDSYDVGQYELHLLLKALGRRRFDLTVDDIRLLFHAAPGAGYYDHLLIRLAAAACERLGPDDLWVLSGSIESALATVSDARSSPEARALRPRLRALLSSVAPAAERAELDLSVLTIGDGWSRQLSASLPALVQDIALTNDTLVHLASATTGTTPAKKWIAAWNALAARGPDAEAVAHALVDALFTAEPAVADVAFWGGTHLMVISPNNADLLRGAIWATAQDRGDETAALLARLAVAAYHENNRSGLSPNDKITNAAITMLGQLGTSAAIIELTGLRETIKQQGVRKQIAKALLTAARDAGIRTTRLPEGSVPTFDLARDATKGVSFGATTAELALDPKGKATIEWRGDAEAKPSRTPPATVAAHDIAELKAEAKALTKAAMIERTRLEAIIGEDDDWAFEAWADTYWRHPVTGFHARRLVWRVEPPSGPPFAGIALDDPTRFVDAHGDTRVVDAGSRIRPWHPVRSHADEIVALRAVLDTREVRQPFKQAYREIYLLTPAEQETAIYSNRFAGHILRYQQAFALMKERGWATNYLGGWEAGGAGLARRAFDDAGITAQFFHDPIEVGRIHQVEHCTTDQVRFVRTGDRTATPIPLDEIDPVLLSEAMRDVDLFVGVCSIGNDPAWADRGDNRFDAYWTEYSFGTLGPSAAVRRSVLEGIVPKLKIASRCDFDERHLVVRGDLGTYRIHLGSGNVMMDPGHYLCIVASRRTPPKVFLPFDDDPLLAIVLSKALLLAADTKITDPMILAQMRR